MPPDARDIRPWVSRTAFIVLALTLLFSAYFLFESAQERAVTVVVGVLGGALGWVLGILSSPYDKQERNQFSEYAKIVYGFLTGYLVSKADRLFELALADRLFSTDAFVFRVLYFLAAFFLAFLIAFVGRRYERTPHASRTPAA